MSKSRGSREGAQKELPTEKRVKESFEGTPTKKWRNLQCKKERKYQKGNFGAKEETFTKKNGYN